MLAPASDRAVKPTDNQPQRMAIEAAKDAGRDLRDFLKDTPVIENFDQCRDGDAFIERVHIALASMEDERKPVADPLYAQWKAVNEPYRLVREPLEKLYTEIKRRVSAFKNKVEAARQAEAERLRREAEDQKRRAEEAAAAADDAVACADVGEINDAGELIIEADSAIRDAGRADRAAAIAERNVVMRSPSIVGGKARAMRTVEILSVADPHAAIKALGCTDKIRDAILSAAKEYRKEYGELPPGIASRNERSM